MGLFSRKKADVNPVVEPLTQEADFANNLSDLVALVDAKQALGTSYKGSGMDSANKEITASVDRLARFGDNMLDMNMNMIVGELKGDLQSDISKHLSVNPSLTAREYLKEYEATIGTENSEKLGLNKNKVSSPKAFS